MNGYTFKKEERLCSQKVLQDVFAKGQSLGAYPLRMLWLPAKLPTSYPVQVVFTVPKRTFKHANERNLLKRRLREAYRKHKKELYEHVLKQNMQYAIVIIYTGKQTVDYSEIEARLIHMLNKFITRADEKPVEQATTGIG